MCSLWLAYMTKEPTFWRSLCVLVLLAFMSLITTVWRFVESTYSGVSVIFPIGCQSVVCGIEYPNFLKLKHWVAHKETWYPAMTFYQQVFSYSMEVTDNEGDE